MPEEPRRHSGLGAWPYCSNSVRRNARFSSASAGCSPESQPQVETTEGRKKERKLKERQTEEKTKKDKNEYKKTDKKDKKERKKEMNEWMNELLKKDWFKSVDNENSGDITELVFYFFKFQIVPVCRAVGIPTRSVTNFSSAHDCDGSMTIDRYYDFKGNKVDNMNQDSIW